MADAGRRGSVVAGGRGDRGLVDRDGARRRWWLRRRWVGTGSWPRSRSYGPFRLSGPVAVLIGQGTVSSGEAVAVAFRGRSGARFYGGASYGFSTGNESFRLPDGALLVITSARFADRTGAVHQGPLLPDVPTAGPDALGAALTGLGRQ